MVLRDERAGLRCEESLFVPPDSPLTPRFNPRAPNTLALDGSAIALLDRIAKTWPSFAQTAERLIKTPAQTQEEKNALAAIAGGAIGGIGWGPVGIVVGAIIGAIVGSKVPTK